MAIGGSGTPSCRVVEKNGGLVATGLITNKPAEIIYSDEERNAYGALRDALPRLRRGEAIQCDFSNGQFLKLCRLWSEDRDVRTDAEAEGDTRDAGIAEVTGSATTAHD